MHVETSEAIKLIKSRIDDRHKDDVVNIVPSLSQDALDVVYLINKTMLEIKALDAHPEKKHYQDEMIALFDTQEYIVKNIVKEGMTPQEAEKAKIDFNQLGEATRRKNYPDLYAKIEADIHMKDKSKGAYSSVLEQEAQSAFQHLLQEDRLQLKHLQHELDQQGVKTAIYSPHHAHAKPAPTYSKAPRPALLVIVQAK